MIPKLQRSACREDFTLNASFDLLISFEHMHLANLVEGTMVLAMLHLRLSAALLPMLAVLETFVSFIALHDRRW